MRRLTNISGGRALLVAVFVLLAAAVQLPSALPNTDSLQSLESPSITTSLSANTITLAAGIQDTATLLGASAGAGGTVTYTVYPSLASCTGGTGGTAQGTVTVSNATVPSSSTFAPTSPGVYYWQAIYSGDSSNNAASSSCDTEPPEGLAQIFLGYADTYRPAATGVPSIWNGDPGVIFVGCGVDPNEDGPVVADTCPHEANGEDSYDGGAIRIDNPSTTDPLVVTGPASVTIGSCLYTPWPGLKRTIPPGGTLILTETGFTGDPCGEDLDGNYNFDTSESSGNGNCIPNPAIPEIALDLNGAPTTIEDGGQVLNKGGIDPGDCSDTNEFSDWTRLEGETLTVVDSYVTISPPSAVNPLNATHTLTAQAYVNAGGGAGYVAAPDGTTVQYTLLPGSVGAFLAGNTCTTVNGSCTVTTSSSSAGTDTIQASATVTVDGVTMTRTTGQTAPGHANSPNAVKTWFSPPSPLPPPVTPPPATPPAVTPALVTPQVAAAISITKSPATQAIASGSTANFTIVVTNTGNVPLSNVKVTDPLTPNCDRTSETIPALASMTPNASVTYTCKLADVTARFTNIATATGTPPSGPNVTATDSASVTVKAPFTPPTAVLPKKAALTPPSKPRIAIVKSPKSQTLTTKIVTTTSSSSAVYGTAHFTIKVTNVGNVTLTAVSVADVLSPGCDRSLGTLGPGASRTYRCTRPSVERNFTNIAVASGKPPKGARVKATDHANVKVTVKTVATSPAKFTG
jgi:uncharacterized repeat protein (TIGR01451 family)